MPVIECDVKFNKKGHKKSQILVNVGSLARHLDSELLRVV